MSDINLSVGLHTGDAKKDADNLVRSLDDIINKGKLLVSTNTSIRRSTDAISTGFKFATSYLEKYGTSISTLTATSGTFVNDANKVRDVLTTTSSSLGAIAASIDGYKGKLSDLSGASTEAASKMTAYKEAVKEASDVAAKSKGEGELSAALTRLTTKYAPLNTAINNTTKALKTLQNAEKAGKISGATLAEAKNNIAKATEAANAALSGSAKVVSDDSKSIERLAKTYDSVNYKLEQYRKDLALAQEVEARSTNNKQQLSRVIAALNAKIAEMSGTTKRAKADTESLANSMSKLAGQYSPAITRSEQLNNDIRQLSSAIASGTGNVDHYKRSLAAAKKELADMSPVVSRSISALQAFSGGIRTSERGLIGAARGAKALNPVLSDQVGFFRFAGRAAALYVSSLVTSKLLDTNLSLMALNESLKAIAGSSQGAARSMEMLTNTADQLGYTTLELGKGYKLISASARGTALEGEAIDAIFKSITSSSRALGLSAADTEGSLRA